ncbi:MAG TPA: lysophospholipid acyltransferase family protein [Polyangia bacterium]|nr:lysophospholipid acyltransferase family protein [Polyangia bacterium]
MRRLWLLIRVGLAGLAFLGFWVGGALLVLLAFPASRLRHPGANPRQRAAACQRWVQRAFTLLHDYMRWCGLLHFQPRTADPSTPGPRFVMVANHPTLVDVAALTAVYGRVACAAKSILFRTPVVGSILRGCAYLDGGNGGAFSGASVVNQALQRLADDIPVLVFPEGTRSPLFGLHPFKRGAFEIACRADVPLLPILIRCDPPALGKGRPWYDIPSSTAFLTATPLPPMNPRDFDRDASRMAAHCEAMYRRLLDLRPIEPSRSQAAVATPAPLKNVGT